MFGRVLVARGQHLWRQRPPPCSLFFQGNSLLGKCRWKHSLVPFGNGEYVATLQLGPTHDEPNAATPPLVLLGGTAQTINGWVGHHKQLSAGRRRFLQYELRGQGRTTLNLSDCSLKQHIADFERLITRELQIPAPVDLVRPNNPPPCAFFDSSKSKVKPGLSLLTHTHTHTYVHVNKLAC